jgi:hypothetical protein
VGGAEAAFKAAPKPGGLAEQGLLLDVRVGGGDWAEGEGGCRSFSKKKSPRKGRGGAMGRKPYFGGSKLVGPEQYASQIHESPTLFRWLFLTIFSAKNQ